MSTVPPYLSVLENLVKALEAGDEGAASSWGAALSKLVESRPALAPDLLARAVDLQAQAEKLASARLEQAAKELSATSTAARAARVYGGQR